MGVKLGGHSLYEQENIEGIGQQSAEDDVYSISRSLIN
jgi:hypothetical protein